MEGGKMEDQEQQADKLVIEAERFNAAIEAPPQGNGVERDYNLQDNDDFFHFA